MNHRKITIHYHDGTDQPVVIDQHRGVRTFEDEKHTILHFGRTEGTRWSELVAAPQLSVRSWD